MHTTIHDLIDIAKLRPEDRKGKGVCHGLVVAFMLAVFSNNLDEVQQTLSTIKKHFKGLTENELKIRSHEFDLLLTKKNKTINETQDAQAYLNILALLSCIAICQSPTNYFFGSDSQFPDQHKSINKLGEFFLFQSDSAKQTHSMQQLASFTAIYTRDELIDFFRTRGERIVKNNLMVGFAMANCTHVIGCIYAPLLNQWILIGDHDEILTMHSSLKDLATDAWGKLSLPKQKHRVLFIRPVTTKENENILELILRPYQKALRRIMEYYTPIELSELYVNAASDDDETTLKNIIELTKIDLYSNSIQKNAGLLSGMHNKIYAYAIKYNFEDISYLLSSYGVRDQEDIILPNGDSYLHVALKYNREDLATMLIQRRMGVNIKDKKGNTPLFYALRNSDEKNAELIVKSSLDKASLNTEYGVHEMNWTVLHHATWSGMLNVAQAMIESNVDVNAQTTNGWTPLHFAMINNHKKIIMLLLTHKAINAFALNEEGKEPLDYLSKTLIRGNTLKRSSDNGESTMGQRETPKIRRLSLPHPKA